MAFANLLHFAGVIELDEFEQMFVAEIRDRRIVEGDVAVFADPHATEIDWLRLEKIIVTLDFIQRQWGVSFDVMKGARFYEGFDSFAKIAAKTRFVIGFDA